MQTSSSELSTKIKTKFQLYGILSKSYYLPEFKSRSINRGYLIKYCLINIPIFSIKKEEIVHHNFRYRKLNSVELLDLLEKALASKNLKPTCFDMYNLPDQVWMKNILLHLDKNDPHSLLSPAPLEENNFKLEVSTE